MPSVRKLKKDIDYLIFEVIADSFTFKAMHPDEKPDEVSSIISEAVSLRNDLIKRVNNPERSDDRKIVKAHFQHIVKDLFTGVDKLCSRLSRLPKKGK